MLFDVMLLSDEELGWFREVMHICRNFSRIPSIDDVDRQRLGLTATYLEYFLRTETPASAASESAGGDDA